MDYIHLHTIKMDLMKMDMMFMDMTKMGLIQTVIVLMDIQLKITNKMMVI